MKVAWFSCGATSAVACKLALQMYDAGRNEKELTPICSIYCGFIDLEEVN